MAASKGLETYKDARRFASNRQQPFKPFTMLLADGTDYRLSHPVAIAAGDRGAVLIVFDLNRVSGDRPLTAAIWRLTKLEQEESALLGEECWRGATRVGFTG